MTGYERVRSWATFQPRILHLNNPQIGYGEQWSSYTKPTATAHRYLHTRHDPAHVFTGPGQAKINLLGPEGTPELVWSIGIKRSDMRRLFAEVVERRDELLRA
jgi:hypothetical protein